MAALLFHLNETNGKKEDRVLARSMKCKCSQPSRESLKRVEYEESRHIVSVQKRPKYLINPPSLLFHPFLPCPRISAKLLQVPSREQEARWHHCEACNSVTDRIHTTISSLSHRWICQSYWLSFMTRPTDPSPSNNCSRRQTMFYRVSRPLENR